MKALPLKLGVLDQSPIARGEEATDAIANTMALAKRCDELGYHRYWVAEHHASNTLASSSPEILITRLAAETERIRVGSGGVMLSHYSPFKVAENFRLLEVLYPGRIDLGVGRAPGSDGLTAAALAYGNPLGIEYYPAKVKDLIAFVSGGTPITEAFHDLKATPRTATTPEVWMLVSSYDSAAYAARFGLPYSHAHFIAPQLAIEALQQYRERFAPEHLTKAYASVGVFAIAVEDPERAGLFRRMREIQRIRRDRGQRGPAPTLEEAAEWPFTDEELKAIRHRRSRQIIGTPEEVKADIEDLAAQSGADEAILLTITPTFADRLRSYELIAEAFGIA
ncbi:MAG: LLM class flavin-dependent oxidoreductase [Gammaproteobacteria bacterium]|nr:LLM class flavin-dependent oxidoreductase [Gammaproteobacteria bacterium]